MWEEVQIIWVSPLVSNCEYIMCWMECLLVRDRRGGLDRRRRRETPEAAEARMPGLDYKALCLDAVYTFFNTWFWQPAVEGSPFAARELCISACTDQMAVYAPWGPSGSQGVGSQEETSLLSHCLKMSPGKAVLAKYTRSSLESVRKSTSHTWQ